MQKTAEQLLARTRRAARERGIQNAALLLVDHRTAEVRAMVGNFDWFDHRHGGQIPGFAIPRSTGSLIKPLIYGVAIHRGMVLPEYLVQDIPVRFGSFAPRNYDGRFRGFVRLDRALAFSLNVPFVHLMRRLGTEKVVGQLHALGFRHIEALPGHYGLSAAAGGLEATALEVASLYVMLASKGVHRPLRFQSNPGRRPAPGLRMISEGAAFLVRRTLSRRDRPDFPGRRKMKAGLGLGSIHWKTGTSNGHRDGWAAGSGRRYTGVVWFGNFDNRPSRALTGSTRAAPVLFDLLEGVDKDTAGEPTPPSGLHKIRTCAYSGRPAAAACPRVAGALAPVRSVPVEKCRFHLSLMVDTKTGEALSPECRNGRPVRPKTFVVWPGSVRRWLSDQGRALPPLPRFAPGCTPPEAVTRPPHVLSPPAGQALVLANPLTEVPLEAESPLGMRLSWFVDGRHLGTVRPEKRLWWRPTPGIHTLLVEDEAGSKASRTIEVLTPDHGPGAQRRP